MLAWRAYDIACKFKEAVDINKKLAGQKHPKTKVPFDKKAQPDFSKHLYNGGKNKVKINPTRNKGQDFAAANKAAGYLKTPTGYTWHHHQDHGVMELVETTIHNKTPHTGGWEIWGKHAKGKKNIADLNKEL